MRNLLENKFCAFSAAPKFCGLWQGQGVFFIQGNNETSCGLHSIRAEELQKGSKLFYGLLWKGRAVNFCRVHLTGRKSDVELWSVFYVLFLDAI